MTTKHLSANNKRSPYAPFKEHDYFSIMFDVLCRKNQHHVIIQSTFSRKMYLAFFEAAIHVATHTPQPKMLGEGEWFYFDKAGLSPEERTLFIESMSIQLQESQALHVFVLHDESDWLSLFTAFYQQPRCRFIILSKETVALPAIHREQFILLTLPEPNENDVLALLKQERLELEQFHQVLIPEELLAQAYALAKRYLSTEDSFERALLLLDSTAARASAQESQDPTLTTHLLLTVLSNWTHIPVSHLLFNQFKFHEFVQGMQGRIFGQEAAIQVVAQKLQQAQAHLQTKPGPFCSLLLAGSKHAGKKSLSIALADQLFKQTNLFYFTKLTPAKAQANTTLDALRFQRCRDNRYFTLKEIITQKPFAVILWQEIENTSSHMQESLQEILLTGFWHDKEGHEYDFRQAIMLFSTTIGAQTLANLVQQNEQALPSEEQSLLQLVLHMSDERQLKQLPSALHYSAPELVEVISSELNVRLVNGLHHHLTIAPFLPRSKVATENIIRIKLKSLGKMLNAHHGIDLGYAAEVVRYLASLVQTDIEKALQPLYFMIEQAILIKPNQTNSQQLFLQLNETGEALRCDWLERREEVSVTTN